MASSFFKRKSFYNVCYVLVLLAKIHKETSGEEFSAKRVTRSPVFLQVGQTLRLKVNIHHPDMAKQNTTAFWVFKSPLARSGDGSLLLIRQIGTKKVFHHSWSSRVEMEGQADLKMVNVNLRDAGEYVCKFRRPPSVWDTYVVFHVIVEDEKVNRVNQHPKTVFVARGDPLQLTTAPVNLLSYHPKYGAFWDFTAASLSGKNKKSIRVIGMKENSHEAYNPRASLKGKGTLILNSTRTSDSGIYSFRMLDGPVDIFIREDFRVIVQDRPKAEMTCPNIIGLTEGENLSCWCEATSAGHITPTATWIKNGEPFKRQGHPSRQKISIWNFKKDMAGTYICRASVGTLIDEQRFKIVVVQTERTIKKRANSRMELYLIISTGFGGLILGTIFTLLIQWMRRKIMRKDLPRYEEPVDVKPHYEELDLKEINDEPCYQPLQYVNANQAHRC